MSFLGSDTPICTAPECCVISVPSLKFINTKQNKFSCRSKQNELKIMAEENKDMEVDDQELMEEGDEEWEYYDDNDVLTDFWQVSIILT